MTPSRKYIEKWLKTIDVRGNVLDVGGAALPIKGRTKKWDVEHYEILDEVVENKGKTDVIMDLNGWGGIQNLERKFNVAFCIEVSQFVFRPFNLFSIIRASLKDEGILYATFHFEYPDLKGHDYLRYTKKGVHKILEETKFKIEWENYDPKLGHLVQAVKL